jgi:S-DNA-T family DNA segregation ATPase FtsK/SpoIIIE
MLPGQIVSDWETKAEALAHGFSARDVRVHYLDPGHIALEVFYGDPLLEIVPALAVGGSDLDLYGVPVGRREDGLPWTLQLQEWHWLIAGVTGSGKSSIIWSILRALAPAIHSGMVEVWAVDPKGGMELRPGKDLFAHFVDDSYERMANLLEGACSEMRQRADRLAGKTRKHQASKEEPLIVIIIDELANLTAYQPDVKLRKRINDAVSLLLTQGRAVGVCVVCALQDPRKDVVWFRNLFPGKIGLRLDEPEQIEMVLGDGARRRGARCDQIPESLPGVGFVKVDGVREPVRVRAALVTDADIDEMVKLYKIDRETVSLSK